MSGSPGSRRRAPAGCYWRGKVLWACAEVAGRRHRWSLETDEPAIAKTRRASGKKQLVARRHGDERRSFADVYALWCNWIPHQVSPKTVIRYAVSIGQLDCFLDGRFLDQINGPLIADIIRGRLAADGITNATVKRDLVALSSVMNFAIDEGWCEHNPVLPRQKRIKERRNPIELPRPRDVDLVTARAPGMLAEMISAARATGCRQEELANARHTHLDLKGRRLTVIGKRNKLRVIDLAPFGGDKIFAALPKGIGKAPLFWHDNIERYANVSSRFARITKEVAETNSDFQRFKFHDLRHLHAVEWLRSGRTIYDLQQRLGHSSIKTTEEYLVYLTPDEQRRAKGDAPTTITDTASSRFARNGRRKPLNF